MNPLLFLNKFLSLSNLIICLANQCFDFVFCAFYLGCVHLICVYLWRCISHLLFSYVIFRLSIVFLNLSSKWLILLSIRFAFSSNRSVFQVLPFAKLQLLRITSVSAKNLYLCKRQLSFHSPMGRR